jgi:hypothetical protein
MWHPSGSLPYQLSTFVRQMDSLPFARLVVAGIALLAIAGFIAFKQLRADRCELHNHSAGRVAIVIAVVCCGIGVTLVVIGVAMMLQA